MAWNSTAAQVYKDGPTGSPAQPDKSEIRPLLKQYENAIDSLGLMLGASQGAVKALRSQLLAVAGGFDTGDVGVVFADTDSYNGVYTHNGTTFVKDRDLPGFAADAAAAAALTYRDQAAASASSALSSKNSASSSAGVATSKAAAAAASEANALAYKQDARAAAEASGANVTFFDTKALASAGLAGVPANGIVEVFTDETRGNARTRYRKESGSLVFKTIAGIDIDDSVTSSFEAASPVVLRGIVEQLLTADAIGPVHGTDDTVTLLKARDAAESRGEALVLPRGVYTLSQQMDFSKSSLILMPGATLRAKSGFSGTSMVRMGDPTAAISENIHVEGGGVIDCANHVDMGVDWAHARKCRFSNLQIRGANLFPARFGDPDAISTGYEIDTRNVRAIQNLVPNAVGSIGFHYDNVTDCYGEQMHAIGYRKGVRAEKGPIELSKVHVWSETVHGVHQVSFDMWGGGAVLVQCYSDTPHNKGDLSVTDCYGFALHGFAPRLYGCGILMHPGMSSTDGVVTPVFIDNENFAAIHDLRMSGATNLKRWKTMVGGGFTQSLTIDATDDGAATYVDPSTRFVQTRTGGIPRRFLGPIDFNNLVEFNGVTRRDGPPGTSRDIELSTNGVRRFMLRLTDDAESGSNAGSNLAVVAASDGGSFLYNLLTFNRQTGEADFPQNTVSFTATWQKPFKLGGQWLWIDGNNKIRKKGSKPTADFDGFLVAEFAGVPASATATGTGGQFAYDSSYIYICTGTNTWKRVPIASW